MKPVLDAYILSLQKEIQRLDQESDGIVMEQIMNYRTVFVNT